MERNGRTRNRNVERRERQRYQFLERLYLLTGASGGQVAYAWQFEGELDSRLDALAGIVEDLEQLGYVERRAGGSGVCITAAGFRYLQRDAWRRRSIRG